MFFIVSNQYSMGIQNIMEAYAGINKLYGGFLYSQETSLYNTKLLLKSSL